MGNIKCDEKAKTEELTEGALFLSTVYTKAVMIKLSLSSKTFIEILEIVFSRALKWDEWLWWNGMREHARDFISHFMGIASPFPELLNYI